PTPFAGSAILPVSSTTGQGIPELKAALLDLAAKHAMPEEPGKPARLPVDRAFHLKGLGVVVTGTLASGAIQQGDTLELLPKGERVRVRSVQVHGQPREQAEAGERTSLQLTGVARDALARGMQLGLPEAFQATTSLLARFTLLADAPAPIRGFVPVRLHLYASEVLGRMRPLHPDGLVPGETGPVEIRLQAPVSALRGDRFILRRPSPPTTLGGGEILDPRWRRHRGTIPQQALTSLQKDLPAALPFWVQEAGERGVDAADLARRLGVPPAEIAKRLAALARTQKLIEVPEEHGRARRWISPG